METFKKSSAYLVVSFDDLKFLDWVATARTITLIILRCLKTHSTNGYYKTPIFLLVTL